MLTLRDLPSSWFTQFDGEDLDAKTEVSAALATVDVEGYPHLAFLSAGEIVARRDGLAMALWPDSSTAEDLRRDGRAALYAAADGAVWEARLACAKAENAPKETGLALFRGDIGGVRRHKAPYAEVGKLVGFRLLDAPQSIARWKLQVAVLRKLVP